MNYIKELNAFRSWLMLNTLSTSEIALWHTLMSVNNMAGWQEWFTAPNSIIQQLTNLSRQGLDNARNGLKSINLIDYQKGSLKQAGSYKIISLVNSVDTSLDTLLAQHLTITKHKTKLNNPPIVPQDEKTHFAEFVTMTNAEYEKLVGTYGEQFANRCVEVLDNYKGSKGKTYKSDYRAILNWVIDRVKDERKLRVVHDVTRISDEEEAWVAKMFEKQVAANAANNR